MNTNGKLILVALAAALAAAAPACSSDDGGEGGNQPPVDTGDEICDNGVDDDDDGAVDCADPNCVEVASCKIGCTEQVPACEADAVGQINQVCIPSRGEGICVPAGAVSEEGALERGSILVFNQLADALKNLAQRNKAYLVEYFHPIRPDGARATCADLVAAGLSGRAVTGFNIVGSTGGPIATPDTTVPTLTPEMPVPATSQGWLVLSRFYGTTDDQGRPAGELLAIGCKDGVVVPEGAYVEGDESRTVTVTIGPVCDPGDPNSCAGGKTCQVGALVCRDRRCGDSCSALENETCREVDLDGDGVSQPECLQLCDPENLDVQPCKGDGERCDTTPGERPACIPS